jgi:hypothetical protein
MTMTPIPSPPPISEGFETWAKSFMDPLNQVLFDMRDDGGSPEEIALFLLHRAVAELALNGKTRGESHKLLAEHLHYSVDSVFRFDGLDIAGTA